MGYYRKFCIALLCVFALSAAVSAQDKKNPSGDEYYPQYEKDEDMTPVKTGDSFSSKGIQYGGWITPVVIDQRDPDSSLTSVLTTAKLWAKMYLFENSFLYVRVKDSFMYNPNMDGYSLDKTDNVFDLDIAMFSVASSDQTIRLRLGRKFFSVGTGLLLNGRGDGLEFEFFSKYINVNIFGMYTGLMMKDNNPYGLSVKDISDGAERIFAGGVLSADLGNSEIYLMGMSQTDLGDEASGEKTRYRSQYYGIGSKGMFSDLMAYYAEFVFETGKSYMSGTDDQKNIVAFAGLAGVNYFIDSYMKPVLIFQYAWGSGDKDRDGVSKATGNTSGSDGGFVNFGTFTGGLGLRPDLTNIHVIRGGFSFIPFEDVRAASLNRLMFIAKYSFYMKDKTDAPIYAGGSSAQAALSERIVGHGVDASVKWKLFYDLSFFVNYGLFVPGNAYSDDAENRHFTMAGLSLSF